MARTPRYWLVKIISTRIDPLYIPDMYDPLTFADMQAPWSNDMTLRTAANVGSASQAAMDAVGLITNNMACKPVDLPTLRSDRKRRAALDDPYGWVGFYRVRGVTPLRTHEVMITPPTTTEPVPDDEEPVLPPEEPVMPDAPGAHVIGVTSTVRYLARDYAEQHAVTVTEVRSMPPARSGYAPTFDLLVTGAPAHVHLVLAYIDGLQAMRDHVKEQLHG